jgi:hypothetical protein
MSITFILIPGAGDPDGNQLALMAEAAVAGA